MCLERCHVVSRPTSYWSAVQPKWNSHMAPPAHLFSAPDDEIAPGVQRAFTELRQLRLVLVVQHTPAHSQWLSN